jgi:flagellar biosynthetic protein FliP
VADLLAALVPPRPHVERWPRPLRRVVLGAILCAAVALLCSASPASASASAPTPPTPPDPVVSVPAGAVDSTGTVGTTGTSGTSGSGVTVPLDASDSGSSGIPGSSSADGSSADASIDVSFPNVVEKSSNSVVIILLLTVLSVAPSVLVLCTSFTRVVIVLSLTRNAIGIPTVPPQQVIVGLSVFLTLFIMGPTLSQMKSEALDPLLDGTITTSQALDRAEGPLREFLLAHTREGELQLFLDASKTQTPVARDEVPLTALVPAFVLSELKSGFIIGFVIFIPFLVIDLVVSAVLMGLGMMMLPPSLVSLPFKLLLFVMLDGWLLVVGTLLTSYK